jgi:hypothetical protein
MRGFKSIYGLADDVEHYTIVNMSTESGVRRHDPVGGWVSAPLAGNVSGGENIGDIRHLVLV